MNECKYSTETCLKEKVIWLECEPYKYGVNCTLDCGHCKHGVPCSVDTGICSTGCEKGWTGTHCTGKLREMSLGK